MGNQSAKKRTQGHVTFAREEALKAAEERKMKQDGKGLFRPGDFTTFSRITGLDSILFSRPKIAALSACVFGSSATIAYFLLPHIFPSLAKKKTATPPIEDQDQDQGRQESTVNSSPNSSEIE